MTQAQQQLQVANEILHQLGGSRFKAMTGSKQLLATDSGLRMNLSANKSGANRLEITLEGDDTYTIHFYRVSMTKDYDVKVITKFQESGFCCDQLQEIFTEVTGLYTKF